jgi:hypothetical protein
MLFIKLLLANILLITASETTDWKLRRDETGVQVYTRNVQGSPFEEFKAVVTISNTTLTGVLDVIMDVKKYPVNFPNCGSSEVLVQKSKYDDIHYITIDAPWPVTDRDAIYEAATTLSVDGKHARVKLSPHGDYIKEKPNLIRVHNGSGFWELDEVGANEIRVVYQFHADPAGAIPAWLANSVIVMNPLKTMESLRDLAKKL